MTKTATKTTQHSKRNNSAYAIIATSYPIKIAKSSEI
jgi:hypothetical protein